MARTKATERARRYWDRSAPAYDRGIVFVERLLLGGGRGWVASRARGDVLEIGVGTGRNLAGYPSSVSLTGIDISSRMLAYARKRSTEIGREVNLAVGDAQALDFPSERFDTVVFCLALCSIPDDRAAVWEATRVLRPGGRLLVMEHVRSPRRAVRAAQRVIDFFTSRLQGDHQLREPLDHLRAAGFEIEELHRSKLGIIERIQAKKPG